MAAWQPIGKHRYHVDGDTVFLATSGPIELLEAQTLFVEVERLYAQYGYGFMLIDASSGASMGPEVRHWLADWHRDHRAKGAAVVIGANPLVRAATVLANAAVRLLTRQQGDFAFVKTEAEARLLLDERRQRYRAAPASGQSRR